MAEKRLDTMEVARRLRLRYHRARDLMLTRFTTASREGGRLTIAEAELTEYSKRAAKPAGGKT